MSEQETLTDGWWATGDMPVRNASRLAFLIDGRMTMLEMCLSFLRARNSIYITAWGLSPELLLVRGKHKCAGSTSSPEQEELLTWLRARGLAEEELLFWQHCDELSATNVLSHAVGRGGESMSGSCSGISMRSLPNPFPTLKTYMICWNLLGFAACSMIAIKAF
jgi:hypothetical protein